jgi:hypothetical protein
VVIPLVIIVCVIALVLSSIGSSRSRMHAFYQQKKQLRIWRKKHGIRQHAIDSDDTPMPFHAPTTLQRFGDARAGISTERTDQLFASLRRLFGSRSRNKTDARE